MNKEILHVVDAVSNEKNVTKDLIFQAVETALAMATRKRYGMGMDVRVSVNRQTGDYDTFRRWKVMDDEDPEFETPERQILISYAKDRGLDVEIGTYIEEPIASVDFGRIAAQTAKQVIVAKVREAEREKVVSAYRDRVGQLVMGVVKRADRKGVVIDLGENAEAFIPREEMIPGDNLHTGARVRGLLKEIRQDVRGPQMIISRADVNFLTELMKLEVPEVSQEMIDIMGAARDPGSRAKVAVRANLPNVDPIGACVGMRGSRIQTVTNELGGKERVDIVLWNADIATYVMNAMAPAEVLSIVVDEEARTMDIGVDSEKLSQAIGRGGQNVRLASDLTGWILNVMSVEEAEAKTQAEQQALINLFMDKLDVDEEVAGILAEEGFSTLEDVAYVPVEEFLAIEGFDAEIVGELRDRAQTALLSQAISQDQHLPAEDLLHMDGMDEALAFKLATNGICTMEDLAEQAVDELVEIGEIDETRAATLIMTARAPWFADDNKAEA
ncbi:MAG: transcription termination/antitermination protein NusA [Pseudomonadota bacterium]|jgi:N utilization substance protein A|uniref:Transcription termination/antitermination protein NusA n=1 Tax=Thiothrix unzii TaxID=111769 RepID=A0A975FC41_9GAMM|nr:MULTISPECIES: transcription termination factor NusA [Thiothrix]MDX9989085.1 transcription termination factor NusA [Thiothrix unzii]QTR54225.1 transcription termination/antitermination protein NusA [Thiothrix unzii]